LQWRKSAISVTGLPALVRLVVQALWLMAAGVTLAAVL